MAFRSRVVILFDSSQKYGSEALLGGLRGPPLSGLDLARRLASSPVLLSLADAVLIFRPAPAETIAILGAFGDADEARLVGLREQLTSSLARLRYVDYRLAETDCQLLAERLVDCFGREALREFRFQAIPRGGQIVLGMLSYLLDLNRDQLVLSAMEGDKRPVVIVDDCALTGLRFGQFIQSYPERQIVFAHLYSHPDLRRAVVEREPRVLACVSACDLNDHAPDQLGEATEPWRQKILERAQDRRYWVGLPDHICFAWSEPDYVIWNPVTEQEEPGLRLLSPELCLKHRVRKEGPSLAVQIQPVAKGPLKPSPEVLFGTLDGQVIAGHAGTGISYSLEGVAGDMWQALVEHGSVVGATSELEQLYDVPLGKLTTDVAAFVDQLLSAGLLVDDTGRA